MSNTPDDPPPSSAPASVPASGDCAEIPAAAHAVLEAAIKIVVELPYASTDSSQPAHKFTLSSEDGSYTKTLSFPSDCQPGDTDGTSVLTFDGLNDSHTYAVHGEDDQGAYVVLDPTEYHQVVPKFSGPPVDTSQASPDSSPAPPMDGSGCTATGDPGGSADGSADTSGGP